MEGTDTENIRPISIADMLPELTELLKQNTLKLTAKKKTINNSSIATVTRTLEKFKPLTIAEMRADMDALMGTTSKKKSQPATSNFTNKKRWNSSVKVEKKTVSHTGGGQMKHNAVRKVLYSQNKNTTPKFPKPDSRSNKSIHPIEAIGTIRVSGVYKISETPLEATKPVRSRMTMVNKENIPNTKYYPRSTIAHNGICRKQILSPKPPTNRKTIVPRRMVPNTPLSNDSWKSSCDDSFLQKEHEIDDHEQKVPANHEQQLLENIAEVTPPASTPLKDYRNGQEYLNYSSELDNSVNNDTIMCFEKPSVSKPEATVDTDINKKDESSLVSLCDLFDKATITNKGKSRTELDILIQIKSEIENNLKSHITMLNHVNRLIKKQKESNSHITLNTTVTDCVVSKLTVNNVEVNTEQFKRCSVIRSPIKSPSYKIPKKNTCLKKKVISRSMPDISSKIQIPKLTTDNTDKAMTMYMNMKEKMNFLNTPLVNRKPMEMPDTPALTSHNLQMQLDKLFNNS